MLRAIGILVAFSLTAFVNPTERTEELFTAWAEARDRADSLIVEFTLEQNETHGEPSVANGTLRLLRTKNGKVFGSYELKPTKPNTKPSSCLLHNGVIYVLRHDNRTAYPFEPEGGKVLEFLERNFNPFVVLLDRTHAESRYEIDVIKQDEWYSYVSMKAKKQEASSWFSTPFPSGRVAFTNKDLQSIPKNMPRQIEFSDGTNTSKYDIRAWKLNDANGPKVEEFTQPEDRPGWTVAARFVGGKIVMEEQTQESKSTGNR